MRPLSGDSRRLEGTGGRLISSCCLAVTAGEADLSPRWRSLSLSDKDIITLIALIALLSISHIDIISYTCYNLLLAKDLMVLMIMSDDSLWDEVTCYIMKVFREKLPHNPHLARRTEINSDGLIPIYCPQPGGWCSSDNVGVLRYGTAGLETGPTHWSDQLTVRHMHCGKVSLLHYHVPDLEEVCARLRGEIT